MKIAVPVRKDKKIDDHFGHCEFYSVYTISDQTEIVHEEVIPAVNGCGCKSNIASVLSNMGVSLMLAGGIGNGAINVLNDFGIKVIRGCSGNASDAVKLYLTGSLTDSGESCRHHEHHHALRHECGQ